jgi:sialate O-acetylesterase
VELQGVRARLTFRHADGLHVKGEKALGFAVAGKDGVFSWAEARVEGNAVVLAAPDNTTIASVRYNWDDNPVGNLYNSAGLPMLPFRTDDRAYTTAPVAEEYGRLG